MEPPRQRNVKERKNLSDGERRIVSNVGRWVGDAIRRERLNDRVFLTSRDKSTVTSQLCGISRATAVRCMYNLKAEENERGPGRPAIELDDFDKNALSRLILGFYRRNPPVLPTLDMIHSEAMNLPGFPEMGRSTLATLIRKLGFVCKKRNAKMNVYQRMDIVAQRHKFLRRLPALRADDYKVFYQDETWCNANHTREYVWQLQQAKPKKDLLQHTKWNGGLKVPVGAGKRLIINHIGSEDGFLEGCGECFVGKKDSGDYHHEMNAKHFERWWEEEVLPRLPQKSVTLIDNASYHTRQTDESKSPTTKWRKQAIRDWLTAKGKPFSEKDTVPILLHLSKEIFVEKRYVLETITEKYCSANNKDIIILRLPVGHSELNAIELIWAQAKNEVARRNVFFNITKVKELVEQALENVTQEDWQSCIRHTRKVEEEFCKSDFGEEDGEGPTVNEMIIHVSQSDFESDADTSEDDE